MDILLLDGFRREIKHGRPTGCFGNRFSVIAVVLVGLGERLTELQADQLHLVPHGLGTARPVMDAVAGFPGNPAGRDILGRLRQFGA